MKLTEVCDFQGGSQPPKEEWSFECHDGYIRMLQIRDFTQSERVTPEYIKIRGNIKTCTTDDILIARYGASLGKILTGLAGAYNVAIMRTIPDEKYLRKKYLYYYLQSPFFQNCILNVGSRAAQAGFNKDDLSEIEIQCPALIVQDCIIKQMEKLDTIIKYRKEELSKLDTLVKSRFIEMFGDPVTNPMGWEVKKLDSICENLDSRRIPVKSGNRTAGIYPYYGASGIVDYVDDYIFDERLLLVSEDGANLLMRSTPIAFSVSGKIWVNNHAHVLKFNDEALQCFVEQYFAMVDISNLITGSAQPKLNQQKLNDMVLPVPSQERLDDYWAFMQQVDKSKSVLQKLLEKQGLLRAALMQEYFG